MRRALSPKQITAIHCPTCGASPGEKCELTIGIPRFEPHQTRRLLAVDIAQTIIRGLRVVTAPKKP